jgi:hypothetical protein
VCLGAPRPTGLHGQPFEHRPAPIVDTGRARFRAIGERLKQIGQLGVAMLFHEPRHIVGPMSAARANDRQRRVTKVGQDDRAVARHRSCPHKTWVLRLQPAAARLAPVEVASVLRHDLLQAQVAGRGDRIALGQNPTSLVGFDVKRTQGAPPRIDPLKCGESLPLR